MENKSEERKDRRKEKIGRRQGGREERTVFLEALGLEEQDTVGGRAPKLGHSVVEDKLLKSKAEENSGQILLLVRALSFSNIIIYWGCHMTYL